MKKGFNNTWKKLPYWTKGAIVSLIFFFGIFNLSYISGICEFILLIIALPIRILPDYFPISLGYVSGFTGLLIIYSIIIGSLSGLMYGGFKSKKEESLFLAIGVGGGLIIIIAIISGIIFGLLGMITGQGYYKIVDIETTLLENEPQVYPFITKSSGMYIFSFKIKFSSDNPCDLDLLSKYAYLQGSEEIETIKSYKNTMNINESFFWEGSLKEGLIKVNCEQYPTNYKLNATTYSMMT